MGFLLNVTWITLVALVLGFLWFVGQIPDTGGSLRLRQPADVIVVLTGGEGRVAEGARLLQTGKGRALYVSGTHPSVKKKELFQDFVLDAALRRCCVVLDPVATNTRGNARETARWLVGRQAERVILVTADWHMPRSLLEFHTALPRAEIIPRPVRDVRVPVRAWWDTPAAARTLAVEYLKYLVALAKQEIENKSNPMHEDIS
jgi:uncharacterized SAM-binding protein YcdF (DUF218 family)